MNALVTGATGFTGGRLARFLVERGDTVRALVRDRSRATALTGASIEIVEGNLKNRDSLVCAMRGMDVVYNIAALYREAGLSSAEYRAVNATAVGEIVEVARSVGVRRVVQCSTVGVHGDVEHPPANEDAPLRPGDVYQESKLEGERVGADAARRTGLEFVIARPSGIYGPADRRLFKVFGKVAQKRFVMFGRGAHYYHVTYIDDLCAGFRLCATVPAAAGRTYILAGGELTTLGELVKITADVARVPPPTRRLPVWPVWLAGAACEAVCAPFGIPPPLYRRRVDFFRKSRAFDISRARRELGFEPKVGLREGIGRTLGWYREQGWI
ncbi:MAG TPA: NAD-dependent epimerase/dehydratase family protein [Vicinamibacterales bacterium]|nr:NAD-dependent epimerase/dehydratase family protein [Vicinamibacterales bacterium]